MPRAHLDDYLDFQLIVLATQRIHWLIYLPFVSILFWCSRGATSSTRWIFRCRWSSSRGSRSPMRCTARCCSARAPRKCASQRSRYYEETAVHADLAADQRGGDQSIDGAHPQQSRRRVRARRPATCPAGAAVAIRRLWRHADHRIPIQALACSPLNHATSTPSARNVTGNIWVHVSRLAR